jgi:hypothetical protein
MRSTPERKRTKKESASSSPTSRALLLADAGPAIDRERHRGR